MASATLGVILQNARLLAAQAPNNSRTDGELLRAFLAGSDPAAFEAIVRRHGPMVLRVSRYKLGSPTDAEDAFQATFLLLARRPASIRKRESLAGWLHGVAHRMAADVRRAADRRRKHEQKATPTRPADPALTAAWHEIQVVLEEEIGKLPETYREPFVLCCLEHLSCSEVAARLGRDETVVRNRLSRARKLLRERLARRGVSVTAALVAAALSGNGVLASVPRALTSSTVEVAAVAAAGKALTGDVVPARVISLVEGANKVMVLSKCKAVVVLLVAVGLVGGLVGLATLPGQSAQPPAKDPAPIATKAAKPAVEDEPTSENGTVEVRGRVFDPDGKPVAGATVVLAGGEKPKPEAVTQTTGPDGRFRLPVQRDDPRRRVSVVASAKGYGPDWTCLDPAKRANEITLRLTNDDVPVTGRIVDLEGKPVVGATAQVVQIGKADVPEPELAKRPNETGIMPAGTDARLTETAKPASNSVAAWVDQSVKWLATHTYASEAGLILLRAPAIPVGVGTPVTTDEDGRFRLEGIGRDRAAVLDVRGPGIERRRIWVVTLHQPAKGLADVVGLYGPAFEHLAGPAKPASGVVTDKATGKPLAGVRVVGSVPRMGYAGGLEIDAVTDAEGRYRLEGLPKSTEYFVTVDTLAGLTYLPQEKTLGDTEGLKSLRADFALVRGTVVEGRVLDRKTGKPIRGEVKYYPLPGNDQFHVTVQSKMGLDIRASHPTGNDGSFRLLVFPGPGVICAFGDIDTYLLAAVTEKDAESGVGGNVTFGYQERFGMTSINGHAYHVIQPGEKPESLKFDLKLDRGRTITGSVTADGKAVAGVRAAEFRRYGAYDLPVRVTVDEAAGTFTATGLNPREQNLMVFYREREKQVGTAEPRGDENRPIAVRLHPWGTVRGRILDPDGKPVAGASIQVIGRDSNGKFREFLTGPLSERVKCDGDGRFQVNGLAPGLEYEVNVRAPDGSYGGEKPVLNQLIPGPTKAGQQSDIGDVKISPPRKE